MNKHDLIYLANKVNNYRLNKPQIGDCNWECACYFLGVIPAYKLTGDEKYLAYAAKWAQENDWTFFNDHDNKTTNADSMLCGEIYVEMIDNYGIDGTDEEILKTMDFVLSDPACDYWWWIDTIYMALPFLCRMGIRQNDERYFEKAYKLFINTKVERGCYDEEEGLWFRDERFLPDKLRTRSGKKVFWSRGNGWVICGIARALEYLRPEDPYYEEYLSVLKTMAQAVKNCQSADGFWRTSLAEPDEFKMPETSGTLLFALSFLKGYKLGFLGKEYLESAEKGFEAINREALFENGKIGWVQTVAWGPGPVNKEANSDYATGTYLQICNELATIYEGI